ncbi:MAG: dihydroorotase [Acidimicrobiales bacterium]
MNLPAANVIVRSGVVVTPGGAIRADLRIEDGRIAEVGPLAPARPGDDVVDAGGCYVLPGGVDPHCHVMADVAAAARAAALGGTTTILSFTSPDGDEPPGPAVRRARRQIAEAEVPVDVGLHAACYRPDELTADDLEEVAGLGADAIKVFLAYPELGIMASGGGLLRAMGHAARVGLPVQVHCEDGEMIEALVARAAAAGRRDLSVFAEVRPAVAEELAVHRTIALAALAGARCYLPHLSTAGALDAVRRARAGAGAGGGAQGGVTAEVCLHHALLDEEEYDRAGGEDFLVAPPLRPRSHVTAVGRALADGTVDALGSDHSQARTPVDPRITPSPSTSYGIPGIGVRVPLFLSWGMRQGLPIERLSHLLATGPAQTFGYGSKGALVEGMDGDFLVWDPEGSWALRADSFPDGTDCAPYAGREVTGRIRSVYARGRALVRDGEPAASGGGGRVLERGAAA